jgi:hypothetical protein
VGQDGVSKRRVRQAARHRDLRDGHHFAGLDPERGEAEDAVVPLPRTTTSYSSGCDMFSSFE